MGKESDYGYQEYNLPNGVEVVKVSSQEMAEVLKKAPVIVKWPFFEEVPPGQARMNVGASSCLMVTELSGGRSYQGHFSVVEQRQHAQEKEKQELAVYDNWIRHIQSVVQRDPDAVIVLFGQHQSNLEAHRDSSLMKEMFHSRREQVNKDLQAVGVNPDQVLDLRGTAMGSTAVVYDDEAKRLYYTVYPPKKN